MGRLSGVVNKIKEEVTESSNNEDLAELKTTGMQFVQQVGPKIVEKSKHIIFTTVHFFNIKTQKFRKAKISLYLQMKYQEEKH